jgi:hypothetical protein
MKAAAATISDGPMIDRLLRHSARAIVPRLASPSFKTATCPPLYSVPRMRPADSARRHLRRLWLLCR